MVQCAMQGAQTPAPTATKTHMLGNQIRPASVPLKAHAC